MSNWSREATLDDPSMRARLRTQWQQPDYVRRRPSRPQPRLLADVTSRVAARPSPVPAAHSKRPKLGQQDPVASVATPAAHHHPSVAAPVARSQPSRSQVLKREVVAKKLQRTRRLARLRRNKVSLLITAAAVLVFGVGLFVSFSGWRANRTVQAQAVYLTKQANTKNESSSVPSTTKPSAASLVSYTVAPDLPRYIKIPKLDVDARVLQVGVTKTGALGTPSNVYDTAWYDASAKPGQPGAMLIDGHVSSWTAHGVFYGLKTLVAGDAIQIQRGDGTIFNYRVVKTQVYSASNVDMTAAMTPIVPGTPGLNLITCAGDVIPGTSQFNERIVVFAEQV